MPEQKRLIVGASGQVGTQLLEKTLNTLGPEGALATSRARRPGWLQLDLAELSELPQLRPLLQPHALSAIYCVAGMTNVDACEDAVEVALQTNARGPAVLAHYARELKIPFAYFSTEYLFDGSEENSGPYSEDSPPHPLNAYGRSKLSGERAVLQANPEALVLRTTVVYGADPRQKNYAYSLMRNLSAGIPMRVPEDQVSTPTYNRDLVLAAIGLVEAGATGIFHVCGPELLSRLDFARALAIQLQLDPGLLHGVTTAELGQPAKRPLQAGLSSKKLLEALPHLHMRSLREALTECLPELRRFLRESTMPNGGDS